MIKVRKSEWEDKIMANGMSTIIGLVSLVYYFKLKFSPENQKRKETGIVSFLKLILI